MYYTFWLKLLSPPEYHLSGNPGEGDHGPGPEGGVQTGGR